jgi:D-glycero-D-manno-heptose 1,7-bisphosphate phosphatase
MARPALFLDRDGTVNIYREYLYRIEDFAFMPGMPEIIKNHNARGFFVIVLTNQAGIARGYYTENDMHALHRFINAELLKTNAHIDAFYFCPHHPDITGPCHCRKPETGMIEQALRDFDIDISKSLMVGDRPWDIECGERMRIRSMYVGEFLKPQ